MNIFHVICIAVPSMETIANACGKYKTHILPTVTILLYLFPFVPAGYLYVTCLIQNCSDKMVTAQFLGKIDHNSLLVQDDYIFVKVNIEKYQN